MNRLGRTDSDRASPLVRKKKLHQGGILYAGKISKRAEVSIRFRKAAEGRAGPSGPGRLSKRSQSRCLRTFRPCFGGEARLSRHFHACRLNSGKINGSRFIKSSGTRIKPNTIKKENRRFSKRRNEVSHKVLLPTFLSRKVGQPLRVSAQAAYLATFSSQAALLSPLARM